MNRGLQAGLPQGRRPPADAGAEPAPTVAPSFTAGFSRLATGASARRGGISGAVWYPARAREAPMVDGARVLRVAHDVMPAAGRFPLVVASHDSGGSAADHHGLAEYLARRGHVVLAPTHPGDNENDLAGVLGPGQLLGRCRHVSRAIDYVLGTQKYARILDAGRIAGVGCGIGAYTILVLAGGQPDFGRFASHHRAFPDDPPLLPHWEALVGRVPAEPVMPGEARLQAAVLLEPEYDFLFDAAALAAVTQPVMVYELDSAPGRRRASAGSRLAALLPAQPAVYRVGQRDPKVFLAACAPAFAEQHPELSPRVAGFEREAFHEQLNAAILAFLGAGLTG